MVKRFQGTEVIGEVEAPSYRFSEEGDFQPTLDGFRAVKVFDELVPMVDDQTSADIDSALMYGSNVRGLSAFPDSTAYDFESDIDIFMAVQTDDLERARADIEDTVSGYDGIPEITVDVQDQSEVTSGIEEIIGMDPEDVAGHDLPMSYAYTDTLDTLPRLRAFGEGYIAHPAYRGETLKAIESALDYISEDGFVKPEFSEIYIEGCKNREEKMDGFRFN